MANIRVNGEMLEDFRGHNVCILGRLKKVLFFILARV